MRVDRSEVFYALWLDNQHKVIDHGVLFRGTIDGASVYPREVVNKAITTSTVAVIFAHNQPSGSNEPSQADKHITQRLQDALALIDVRVLDHIIIGKDIVSMAQCGLLWRPGDILCRFDW